MIKDIFINLFVNTWCIHIITCCCKPLLVVFEEMASRVDLKVVLLGKEYGGKTSLVERYIHGKFNSSAPYQSVRDKTT